MSSPSPLPTPTPLLPIPRRHPRSESTNIPAEVIGYISTFGIRSAWNCLGDHTWFPVSGYGRCCPLKGDCPVYTTCLEGSIVANDQFRLTCTGSSSQTVCVYGTVYEFPGDPSPKLFPGCWPSWTGGTWYATRTMTSNSTSTSRPLDPDNGSQPWKIVVFVFVAIIGLGICYFGIKRGCAIARKRFNDAIEARVVQSRTADEEAIRSVRASRAPEHYVLSVNNSHEPPKTVQLADSSLAEREPVEAGNVSLKKGRKDSVQEIRSVTAGAHGRRLSEMEAMSRRSESPGRKNNAKRDSGQSSNDPIDVIGNGDSGEVMIATSEGYVDVVSGVHGISTASDDARSSDNTEPLQELEDNAQKRRSE